MTERCALCNSFEGIQIHHINYDPEVTVSLCKKCHIKEHNHGTGSGTNDNSHKTQILIKPLSLFNTIKFYFNKKFKCRYYTVKKTIHKHLHIDNLNNNFVLKGKIVKAYYRKVGVRGAQKYAIGMSNTLGPLVEDQNKTTTLTEVILTDCNNEMISILCKPNGKVFKIITGEN